MAELESKGGPRPADVSRSPARPSVAPSGLRPLVAADVEAVLRRGGNVLRPDTAPPRFKVGDSIVTRNINPLGHTRLPRYARGRRGVIAAHHGTHVFPDSNASGRGPDPHHLYSVRFEAHELWGDAAASTDAIYIDLWEPYLEPPPAGAA
jgi:nitrile hydratase